MRLSDDFDDRHSGVPVIYMAIGMFLFVITVVGAVVLTNKKPQSMERPEESAGNHRCCGYNYGTTGRSLYFRKRSDE